MSPTEISNMRIRAGRSGKLMCTLLWNRRRMAASSCHGIFVAPSIRTPFESLPTPSICTSNSVLIRRDASDSPSPRGPQRASTSSMNMMAGLFSRAMLNNCFTSLQTAIVSSIGIHLARISNLVRVGRTYLSDSPIHLLTRSLLLTEKNVLFASVATAFAK